jgi:Flp pilus assembly protein TadD
MMSDAYTRSVESAVQHSHMLLIEGRSDELLAFSEGAVELFPLDPELHLMYATALLPHNVEKARWEAARAIQLDTDDPGRLVRAARLMLNLGEVEAARSYAGRAAQFATADFLFAPELHGISGVLAALSGEFALAEEALRAAHEAEPDREMFAKDLAIFLDSRGRPVEAVGIIDETVAAGGETDGLKKLRERILTSGGPDS